MNVYAANDTAKNGRNINTVVRLLWDDAEPFADRPFRCDTRVDGACLATSHHRTAEAAKKEANKMHAAYLDVHSSEVLSGREP